ncbi:efflux RND transporter periplasmic adaptor subunit [Carboxylicivirga sp. M1479]|uniref:efflux RND transporter periplasmic adaptor subunit n=1 Tax=Carboxylicivirga sp. M1479 TaxID=2594476 RepID=UPI001178AE95|nr:efflux RND transporter periplasmic adaptor subunit [Carboxylicivirga sp. M1479]TRX70427.1 efflux RND transporter periplasmic adaptor subunit [Carboxylicivirga sp. M1479]
MIKSKYLHSTAMRFKVPMLIGLISLLLMSCKNEASSFSTDVAVNVSVQEVKKKSIEQTLVTTATISPQMESNLKTELTAHYHLQLNPKTGKPFKMGDQVSEGQLIILLEDQEYTNNANLEGAQLDMEISAMEYEKQQALFEKGGVTKRELVNSEKTLLTSEQTYENAQLKIEKLSIRAPFKGVITDLPYFSPGMRVDNGEAVLSIMNYSTMMMDLSMPENLLGEVKVNQLVNIMNYALPDDTLKGRITALSPAIDKEARTFKGRLKVDNKKQLLKPGMFVKAEIVVDQRDSALVIPKDVVLTEGNRKVVFVAKNSAAQKRYIRTGIETLNDMEVLDGLKQDERLIIKGFETLKDRSKVKVVK